MKKTKSSFKVKVTYGSKNLADCLINAIRAKTDNAAT